MMDSINSTGISLVNNLPVPANCLLAVAVGTNAPIADEGERSKIMANAACCIMIMARAIRVVYGRSRYDTRTE